VPGHSEGDTLFFDAADGALFAGDHLLKVIHPNTILQRPRPGEPRQSSLVQYTASLERTRALGARICYPGHGVPFEDVDAVIDRIFQRQERKAAEVLGVLDAGPATPHDVARALFPQLEPAQLFFGLSVASGYLELLEARGDAVACGDDVARYARVNRKEHQ
jgi:glyoxylase-like metal-dependent hydrolase (beta-lactamase superfamily II)